MKILASKFYRIYRADLVMFDIDKNYAQQCCPSIPFNTGSRYYSTPHRALDAYLDQFGSMRNNFYQKLIDIAKQGLNHYEDPHNITFPNIFIWFRTLDVPSKHYKGITLEKIDPQYLETLESHHFLYYVSRISASLDFPDPTSSDQSNLKNNLLFTLKHVKLPTD